MIASPQKLHAVTMVRFARDCMNKMNDLTHDLAETLGEDTGMRFSVCVRILHSTACCH